MAKSKRHDPYKSFNFIVAASAVAGVIGLVAVSLAANNRKNLDSAFLRRIRFILDFPMPDSNDYGRKAGKARRTRNQKH